MSSDLVSLSSAVGKTLAEISDAERVLKGVTSVGNDSEARAADMFLSPARTLVKVVHDQRMAITRRVDAFKKSVISEESAILAGLNAEIERVKALQLAYVTAKNEAIRIEHERAEAEKAAASMEARITGEAVMPDVSEPERKSIVDGVRTRRTWAFEIVDGDAVPRAFCSPSEQAIRQFMQEAKSGGAMIDTHIHDADLVCGLFGMPGSVTSRRHVRADGLTDHSTTIYGYGNMVVIDHGFGYVTRYAHMRDIFIVEGMKIKRGECIGTVGNSGKTTGAHLHYEVIYRGDNVNPANFYDLSMSSKEYSSMVSRRDEESPAVLRPQFRVKTR